MKFTSRPLICILDNHEGEKVENTSPIVFLTFKVYCHWTDVCFLNCCYGYLTFWFSMNHRTSRFSQIYQMATNLHHWQEGSRTMYKKKLHYWAVVAKYNYKDKQWVMLVSFTCTFCVLSNMDQATVKPSPPTCPIEIKNISPFVYCHWTNVGF